MQLTEEDKRIIPVFRKRWGWPEEEITDEELVLVVGGSLSWQSLKLELVVDDFWEACREVSVGFLNSFKKLGKKIRCLR